MKRLIIFSVLLVFSGQLSFGQQQKHKRKIIIDTIQVSGVCNECKERIEDAAYSAKGVKRADWNKHTKLLRIVYKSPKVSLQEIEEHIAHAGHDAGSVKASDSAYNQLPSCCAYRVLDTH